MFTIGKQSRLDEKPCGSTVGSGLLGQAEDEWRLAVAILITGGAGLMGSELARTFLKRGEKVIIFDVHVNHSLDDEKSEHLTQVKGDISNWPEVFNAVKDHNVHAIFHRIRIRRP